MGVAASNQIVHDRQSSLDLENTILGIERDDPQHDQLLLRNGNLNAWALARLADILGRAKYVRAITINYYSQDAEEFCTGLRSNTSIETFSLYQFNLVNGNLRNLSSFLRDNPSLKDLSLSWCNLEPASLNLLSDILLQRDPTLKRLNLSGNRFSGTDLDRLIEALSRNTNMVELILENNGIGIAGCNSIAGLLARPECKLRQLRLQRNPINDQAATVLADSLVTNTTLNTLSLFENNTIGKAAGRAMLKLLCDSSSIESLMESNHTLACVGFYQELSEDEDDEGGDEHYDGNLLRASLWVNDFDNENIAVRKKILWSHTRGDLNIGLSSIPAGAIPTVLEWIGDGSNQFGNANLIRYNFPPVSKEETALRLESIFRIIRSMAGVLVLRRPRKRKLHSLNYIRASFEGKNS